MASSSSLQPLEVERYLPAPVLKPTRQPRPTTEPRIEIGLLMLPPEIIARIIYYLAPPSVFAFCFYYPISTLIETVWPFLKAFGSEKERIHLLMNFALISQDLRKERAGRLGSVTERRIAQQTALAELFLLGTVMLREGSRRPRDEWVHQPFDVIRRRSSAGTFSYRDEDVEFVSHPPRTNLYPN
ncbi:hypothetical protein EJ06DRAFT_530592 [Trichodelitschia bisporula]|uniref:F-box domain-containing protein n=1 Tax=Trichodelitschia bisporula TaxID=703511 RepID=A0A6G1HVB3_9PEZI|nr:hypothetical protein EJ06DRAFT_530592 [Trichodelitschia bisporula]